MCKCLIMIVGVFDGTCVEFGPTQLLVNSFRVKFRVRVRAFRKLGGPEPDTSAYSTGGFCVAL